MSIHNRVKEVRKALNMAQDEFGDKIGIKKSSISQIESGKTNPSDLTVRAICREFRVDETWLRTGVGEMFRTSTPDQQIAEFAGRLLEGRAEDAFKRKLVSALSRLDPVSWAALERVADEIAADEAQKKKELP